LKTNARREGAANRGFSLVEVMVAVVVICVGLLGIAKMESLSQSNMTTSRLRALAAFEAAGLAAAMHTNRDYWANTPANYTITVNPAAAPVVASSDAALSATASADYAGGPAAANGAVGLNACVGTSGGLPVCAYANNPVSLAAYDVARWAYSLKGLLPNPTAAISCPNLAVPAAPTSCTIQISWTEVAVAMNTTEVQQQQLGANIGQGFDTPTYLLYVEP
jgi:type IV pilus assembly protein PilV